MNLEDVKIGIIGLGYVGLPLAAAFGNIRDVIGFDIDESRIQDLNAFHDKTSELSAAEIKKSKYLTFTSDLEVLSKCNCYIVTVPTPIDSQNRPDISSLINASKMISSILDKGDVVIYESTVYPGLTEEKCVPELSLGSKLKFNQDFYVGYSPERINPGDKKHKLQDIVKITSGSNPATADLIDELYSQIIKAGTFKASSIKVAEAAKVIENTQRDVNIALINELAKIFNLMNLDTHEVLMAAETKWNFLPFKPGLVGGHCIGVDPYYLTFKAQELKYNPEIILAGRRINDGMAEYVSYKLDEAIKKDNPILKNSKVLILGLTFKENCPDLRNSKVFDIVSSLVKIGYIVDVYDPLVTESVSFPDDCSSIILDPKKSEYNAIILAVAHNIFIEMGIKKIRSFGKDNHIFYDLKSLFDIENSDLRL